MTYSEHEIKSGSACITLSVWEPQEPEAVIIFVPATMVHPLLYEPLLSGFAESGFAVIGLHPVGHGKSSRGVKRYTIRDIVQNGRDAVTFALERYSLPIVTMGSSQGGLVAAAVGAEDERVAAVFSHNIILTELSDSIGISRFPKILRHTYRPAQVMLKVFAKLFPGLQIPLGFYLEYKRVSPNRDFWDMAIQDDLCLRSYPAHFLVSLFTTRFPALTDGSARCPIYLISDSGDGLFSEEYTGKVFELLQAPYKEMITFHFSDHMFMVMHPREVCEVLTEAVRKSIT